ncbi:hypothetical protein CEE45_00400 [Candidatus Heimdallarchaeota archaeon B3_Heim]|nr:MAG: hypothetical protein CEE45_00400 [Candidatus Heimdallarchaeota archaeon B3_Heim]
MRKLRLIEEEYIFKRNYEDLENYISSKDAYKILKTSAILRLFLLEALIHKTNKRLRLHITFRIGIRNYKILGFPEPDFWSVQMVCILPLPEHLTSLKTLK